MNQEAIKVGICIAYDWEMLKYALPLVYDHADLICLSLDKDRISWSQLPFGFDDVGFRTMLQGIDIQNKVIVLEDDFHLETLSPMQNEVRQRNAMANRMGPGGWHIQLDCDEYFVDFKSFVVFLRGLPRGQKSFNVCCPWVTLFKKVESGFLFVDPMASKNLEFMQIATRDPEYTYSRRNGNFNMYTNFVILHQSWARSAEEIKAKLYNWGHSADLDKEQYFTRWRTVDDSNYKEIRDLHPLVPTIWPRLSLLKGTTIEDVVSNFKSIVFPSLSATQLFFRNSLFFSRIRKLTAFVHGRA